MSDTSRPSTSQANNSNETDQENDRINLKSSYIDLLEEAHAIVGNQNVRETIRQVNNIIDKADKLIPRVTYPSEMYLDAQVLHSTATSLEEAINNLDVGEGNFNLFAFAEQLKLKATRDGKQSWEALASVAEPVIHNTIPSWSPLLGSFEFSAEIASSQTKKRQVRQKDHIVEKKEPAKLSQADKTQEGVEVIVERIFKKLIKYYKKKDQQPLNYFKFVVNPTSFSATVENMFHVSFLVNDGHVKIDFVDEIPVIYPVTSSEGKENSNPKDAHQVKTQNIFCIDHESWMELVAGLKITDSML